MGLRDINIEPEYRTMLVDVTSALVVPLLEQGVSYNRAVGFFSSSALIEISKGIGALAKNGGRIRMIASPNLSEKDVDAIEKGYESKAAFIEKSVLDELPDFESLTQNEKNRYNLLANLIAQGILDIRIAFIEKSCGMGIYHEKVAIVEDASGDKVAFAGSMNESKTALIENYETIDVFCSWDDPQDRVRKKEEAFEAIWNGTEKGVSTYNFVSVKDEIRRRYLMAEPNYDIDKPKPPEKKKTQPTDYHLHPFGIPTIPEESDRFRVLEYQSNAVATWVKNGYRGLFDMATGTGKTITGLIALTRAYNDHNGKITVFITCPYQHLVEQWIEDLEFFNIKPIVAYGSSRQKNWKQQLKDAIFDQRLGLETSDFICCIMTNATFAGRWMQKEISRVKGTVLIIADEAHNLGAPGLQKVLNPNYKCRLALSATMSRHHDSEGTRVLMDYFGEACIHYPIEQAIHDGRLCEYKYYPIPCYLSETELDKYNELTKEIANHQISDGKGGTKLSKSGEIYAQKRARVVAGAASKISLLEEVIQPYVNENHILVYCGATQLLEEDEDFTTSDELDRRQITHVVNLLAKKYDMSVSKFTSEEPIEEREELKKMFSDGDQLQALVAIKCLDEGVNIPSIVTAFMLASTTNPKEYIQRRGRLLRLAKGKKYAEIFDFITLPYPTDDAAGQPIDELKKVFRLVSNELDRGMEFAEHAFNFSSAQSVLDEIADAFRINEIRALKKEGA